MKEAPCNICGFSDYNLIDGYYYCLECGTQDANRKELVVDHLRERENIGYLDKKKIKFTKNVEEVSKKLQSFHAQNYVLVALANKLIDLGVNPKFKDYALWLWIKYLKLINGAKEDGLPVTYKLVDGLSKRLTRSNLSVMYAILYLALSMNKSEIQICDLSWFIFEQRFNYIAMTEYVPNELHKYLIPLLHLRPMNSNRDQVYRFCRGLDIGKPMMPDLRILTERFLKELCLPDELKHIVFSLIKLVPLAPRTEKKRYIFSDALVMSFIMIALKLVFGLDDNKEIKMSKIIKEINEKNNNTCDKNNQSNSKLFCFEEWCSFMQFRKTIISKYYMPLARRSIEEVDDNTFFNYMPKYKESANSLSRDMRYRILDKLAPDDCFRSQIPKEEFKCTLTPWSLYRKVICKYIQCPIVKQTLEEDYNKHSIEYFYDQEMLPAECMIHDIKFEHVKEYERFEQRRKTLILRHYDNPNWAETKRPVIKDIFVVDDDTLGDTNSLFDSDQAHDDSINDSSLNNEILEVPLELLKKNCDINIFDDDFDVKSSKLNLTGENNNYNISHDSFNVTAESTNLNLTKLDSDAGDEPTNNLDEEIMIDYENKSYDVVPDSFDKKYAIQFLVERDCKKNQIGSKYIPKRYKTNTLVRKPATKPKIISKEIKFTKKRVKLSSVLENLLKFADIPEKDCQISDNTQEQNDLPPTPPPVDECDRNNSNTENTNNDIANEDISDIDMDCTKDNANVNAQKIRNNWLGSSSSESSNDDESNVSDHGDSLCDTKTNKKYYDVRQLFIKMRKSKIFNDSDVEDDPEILWALENCKDDTEDFYPKAKSFIDTTKRTSSSSDSVLNDLEDLFSSYNCENLKYWTSIRGKGCLVSDLPRSFSFLLNECSSIMMYCKLDLYITFELIEADMLKVLGRESCLK